MGGVVTSVVDINVSTLSPTAVSLSYGFVAYNEFVVCCDTCGLYGVL